MRMPIALFERGAEAVRVVHHFVGDCAVDDIFRDVGVFESLCNSDNRDSLVVLGFCVFTNRFSPEERLYSGGAISPFDRAELA